MIKAVIVDDEKRARETIAGILKLYCPAVQVVAEAEDVGSALKVLEKHEPNLVLLDINMPGGTGFDLLKKVDTRKFKLVFITAYEEHAVKAFRCSALDYILKPINPDELKEAIDKAEVQLEKEQMDTRLETFLSNMETSSRDGKKMVLKTSDSIHVVNIIDIVRCEADRNYTIFYLKTGKKILVSNTLKEYDDLLASYRFFRAHQSHLVNIDCIERYEKKEGGCLVMNDRSIVPVSVRKKETLLSLLESI